VLLLLSMSGDNAENHRKILGFLSAEFARKEGRQCVGVDLAYSPGNGFKDEDIRKWVRADEPELFDNFINVEKLASQILEIAEGEADAKPAGKHRFFVRTHQHLGGRALHSFALSPSYKGDELALTAPGSGNRADVLANHAAQLMRINAQMYEGTIRVLGAQNQDMRQENAELRAENIALRREVDEARSNKMDREFQIAMAAEKNARTNAGFQKLLQIGSIVAAKIGGPGGDPSGGESPFITLIGEFGKSLRQDQTAVLTKHITDFIGVLDMGQKMMFMEIINVFMPQEAPNGKPADAGGPGGSMLPPSGGPNSPAA
jgi:hypothetical protein